MSFGFLESILAKCLGYDIKLSDCEAPALEIWGIQSTPSLLLLSDSIWSRVVAPDRVLPMGQIEQTVCKQIIDVKLWLLYCDCYIVIIETI